jgi:rsbT co-antagonist protein RsbR
MVKNTRIPEAKVAISRKKIGGEVPIVVSEITEKCLYSGFFGTLDSGRMKLVTDKILNLLSATGIEVVIIDLSNVDIIDSAVAVHLLRLGNTLTLVGVEALFCGIMPQNAQIMVTAGIEIRGFRITRDLKSALKEVFKLQGFRIVRINPE